MISVKELSFALWKELGSDKDVPSDYEKFVHPILDQLSGAWADLEEDRDAYVQLVGELESEVEMLQEKIDSAREALR